VVKPYDCNAEADIWEWAWTPDWKAWCCVNEAKGCPKTTTPPPTTTVITTTLPSTKTATTTVTATHTSTLTTTMTSTATVTGTATSTKTTTVAPTTKKTTTVAPTTKKTTTAIETTRQPEPSVHDHATSKASVPTSRPTATVHATTSRPEATKTVITTTPPPTTTVITTTAKTSSTSEIATPDAGCESACVILGEAATCQARISEMEKQMQHESAPCPAAHVVVMSQCSSCGTCLFKNVKCASKKGVSKSFGHHMFMYKKFSEMPVEVTGEHGVQHSPLVFAATIGLASLLGMVALWRRRERGARVDFWMLDEAELLAQE